MGKYSAVLGPNTNQWWIYDEELDVYIDPPAEVLERTSSHSDILEEQEEYLMELIEESPEWLKDTEHYYDDIDI